MDKIDLLYRALCGYKEKTSKELQECENKMKKEDISVEDLYQECMYGCYLKGIINGLDVIIKVIEEDALGKVLEKLEELSAELSSKKDIAKA